MANLQTALEWARNNPQDERSKKLLDAVANGKITSDSVTAKQIQQEQNPEATSGVFDALQKGFTGVKEAIVSSGNELADVSAQQPTTAGGQFAKLAKTATTLIKAPIKVGTELAIATPLRVAGEMTQNVTGIDVNEAVAKGTEALVKKGMDTETAQKTMSFWNKLKETDPESAMALGAVLDIADIAANTIGIKGAGIVEKYGAKQLVKAGEKSLEIAGKGAGIAEKTGEYVTGQAYGLKPETVKNIIQNPEIFTPKEIAKIDRESIFNKTKTAIEKRLEGLSETGKEYETIRKSGEKVVFDGNPVSKVLEKYGITVGKDGKIITTAESVPLGGGDISAIEGFIKQYGKQELSANGFLNARKALSNMSSFATDKTDMATKIARELRKEFDNVGKSTLSGLADLDARFAPEVQQLSKIKKVIFNADGSIKDNAISKIANLTGKGKEQVLERMEKIVPGITKDVNILKSIEDIEYAKGQKVGSYMRAGLGVGAGAVAGGPVGAILGAIATSPQVGVALLRSYGKLKNVGKDVIGGMVSKMENGKKLVGQEIQIMNEAIDNATKKAGERLKKTKPGMTIEKVGEDRKMISDAITYANEQIDRLKSKGLGENNPQIRAAEKQLLELYKKRGNLK